MTEMTTSIMLDDGGLETTDPAQDWVNFLEASPMNLGVGIRMKEVRDLNPAEGTFYAKFLLTVSFCDPELQLDGQGFEYDNAIHLTPEQVPNLPAITPHMFYNAYENLEIEFWSIWRHAQPSTFAVPTGCVQVQWWVSGTFTERFELQDFPYDVQQLKICLRNVRPDVDHKGWYALWPFPTQADFQRCKLADGRLVKFGEPTQIFPVFTGSLLDEFTLYEPPISHQHAFDGQESKGLLGQQSKHMAVFTIVVQRKPWFFEVNVMVVLFVLTTLSFMTYGIDAGEVADMSSITLTLILTAIAYKFIIADKMPKCSYLTALDKYILACFGMLTLVAIENTFAQWVRPYMFYSLVSLWTLFNLVVLVRRCLFLARIRQALATLGVKAFAEIVDESLTKRKIL